jgi:hypothetical protein
MAYTTIDDPSAHFHTRLYSGNGSTQSITNNANAGNFKPDWLWIKERTSTSNHFLFDSNRGVGKYLHSNSTSSEGNDVHNTSFDSNGFGVGQQNGTNENSQTYVAWQWKANGGTTSSNTDGSITSTVQANTTAGFSIVTYTSNNTEGATFGHGLNSAPEIVIIKGRESSDNWPVFNGTSTTNSRSLHLEETTGEIPVSSYNFWNLYWDETRPSSTVVTLGVDAKVNKSGNEGFVAYCFHSVKGYSKIGKYTGNGNADGAFVYTGFKPKWLITKNVNGTAANWHIYDSERNTSNVIGEQLYANLSNAGADATDLDFTSNGFKWRRDVVGGNASGTTYVYMAFAEHPFVSSKGVPVTAR